MNPKLDDQLKKASSQLTGVMVELEEPLMIKYTLQGVECEIEIARSIRIDSKLLDSEFGSKFFKLMKIIELLEEK